jgi:magnesium transporter
MLVSILEKLTLPEIRELVEERDAVTLRDILNHWMPADLGDLLEDLTPDESVIVLESLNAELAVQAFEHVEPAEQQELLSLLPESQLAPILNAMSPDDRTALLERQPAEDIERLLILLNPSEQRVARSLLSYGEGTVGRLMTPDLIAIKSDWTVNQVLEHVRRFGKDSETLNVVYVTDEYDHLIDDIRIREILLASPERHVSELMDSQYVALSVTDEEADAVAVFRKYDRTALPVIDGRGRLLGIVTIDDVLDVAEEEATREIQKFGGLEALDEPYIATPLWEMVRKRATWLVVLFLGELLTASAMGYFDKEIHKAVVLALFIPLIISSGGNSGSQAATLIVRALGVGEVTLADWWRVMKREIVSGLALGLVLGLIGYLRISIWSQFTDIYGDYPYRVALTVAVSLVGIVMWGTLSGSMLPFLLKRLGFDPATSSAPFVATLVDVTGLVIYFTVALVLLRGTLL